MTVFDSPALLLLATGGLVGLTFPFGKLAAQAGLSPFVWAFVIACGGGVVLFGALLMSGRRPRADRASLVYYAITAAISYALPNLLVLSAIPRLGAGYVSLMFTLSPVLTLLLSLLSGVRRPTALGVAGIAVGFAGAILVATTRGEVGRPGDPLWIALALLIPVSLAAGNIYRSAFWPKDATPIELAAGSNVAAAILLAAVSLVAARDFPIASLSAAPWLVATQVAASALMQALFFRLQVVGGPVYLSQIGYVAAAVGLLSGVMFLGETYAATTWIGGGVIVIGVIMTTLAQRRA
ncbi:DMT family transporter [Terrarubrum flagellatum]|uniref:DMT family transporter n=1 Tax=Terrirubrum flagellatum TaxID=2895980 RepID=UPI00314521A1